MVELGQIYIWDTITQNGEPFLFFIKQIHFLFTDLWAILFRMFGASTGVMMILPISFGILTLWLTNKFGNRWLGKGVGTTAVLLMAVSPYMIGLSRNLWAHIIFNCVYTLLFLHILLQTYDAPSRKNMIWLAIIASCSFYLYRPSYIAFPACVIILGIKTIIDREWRKSAWKPFLTTLPIYLLLLVPFIFYYLTEYSNYLSGYIGSEISGSFSIPIKGIKFCFEKYLYFGNDKMFEGVGMHGGWSNKTGHMHLPFSVGLFALGFGIMIADWRKNAVAFILVVWLVLSTLPALTGNHFFPRRFIMAEPVFFLLAGKGGLVLYRTIITVLNQKPLRIIILAIGITVYTLVGYSIYDREVKRHIPQYYTQVMAKISQKASKPIWLSVFITNIPFVKQ